MFESRHQRNMVEDWVRAQPQCPSRKDTQKQFPEVSQKHIRAAVQSRQDRDSSQ